MEENHNIPIGTSNIYPLLDKVNSKAELKKNLKGTEVIDDLNKLLMENLNEEEIDKLSDPFYHTTFKSTFSRLMCTNLVEKKRILEDILIQKVKFTGDEVEAMNFDKASSAAYELSTNEIRLLVFIDTYSCILCSIINRTGFIENAGNLCSYLKEITNFNLEEVTKCERLFLLFDKAQYEHDLSKLRNYEAEDEEIGELVEFVKDTLRSHYNIDFSADINTITDPNYLKLSAFRLSKIGKIISRTQLKSMDITCIANDLFPLKISDLIAGNIWGLRNVAAMGFYEEPNSDVVE